MSIQDTKGAHQPVQLLHGGGHRFGTEPRVEQRLPADDLAVEREPVQQVT